MNNKYGSSSSLNIETNYLNCNVKKDISDIKKDIDLIKTQLEELNNNLKNLGKSCKNMDNHITFIDSVYSNIRSPMNFIINKISLLSGSPPNTLAKLVNK